jgi:MYXO-CTERM domain-containing protein
MEIIDHDCSETQRGCMVEVQADEGELAASGEADACFGDSGGPLYLETPSGYYLAGITSRGFDNSRGAPCGTGSIFVRPDALIDWIEGNLGYALERPLCEDDTTDTGVTVDTGEGETGGVETGDQDTGVDTSMDDGTLDTGPANEEPGGCGCTASSGGKVSWGLVLVMLGLVSRRRRL